MSALDLLCRNNSRELRKFKGVAEINVKMELLVTWTSSGAGHLTANGEASERARDGCARKWEADQTTAWRQLGGGAAEG